MSDKFNQSNLELPIKRMYVDYRTICPECGAENTLGDPLSYPIIGKPEKAYMYCVKCDHEWDEYLIIKMTVERTL